MSGFSGKKTKFLMVMFWVTTVFLSSFNYLKFNRTVSAVLCTYNIGFGTVLWAHFSDFQTVRRLWIIGFPIFLLSGRIQRCSSNLLPDPSVFAGWLGTRTWSGSGWMCTVSFCRSQSASGVQVLILPMTIAIVRQIPCIFFLWVWEREDLVWNPD